MKIYLLRHGESVDDVEDCYGGIADFSLTDGGRQTAKELASKLAASGIEVIYSSPYKRAYETASILKDTLGCELRIIDDLRERNSYGVMSGVNKAKAKEIFSQIFNQLKQKPGDYYSVELVPGAEPLNEFGIRVKKAFDVIAKDATGHQVIGVVTHGNVTRAIYEHTLGVKGKVELELLAITVINYQPASVEVERKEGVNVKQ